MEQRGTIGNPSAPASCAAARVAGCLLVLFCVLPTAAANDTLRLEPQIGPFEPRAALFNPANPERIVIIEADRGFSLWNVSSRERLLTMHARISNLAFSPDGKVMLTIGSTDGTVKAWDEDGKPLWDLQTGHEGAPTALAAAASHDGLLIATGGRDGAINVRQRTATSNSAEPVMWTWHIGEVSALAFTPDGSLLISGGSDGTVRVWDRAGVAIGRAIRSEYRITALTTAPDGQSFVWANQRGQVSSCSLPAVRCSPPRNAHSDVSSVAFSPRGDLFASGGGLKIQLWTVAGHERGNPLRGHERVSSVAFSPDGNRLLSAGQDGVRFWKLDGTLDRTILRAREVGRLHAAAVSQDGKYVTVAWGDDARLRLLNVNNPQDFLTTNITGVTAVAFRRVEPLELVVAQGMAIQLWAMTENARPQEIGRASAPVYTLGVASDGMHVASGDRQSNLTVWKSDGNNWSQHGSVSLKAYQVQTPPVSILFDASEKQVVVAIHGSVSAWSYSAEPRWRLNRFPTDADVALDPAGSLIAVAGRDGGSGAAHAWIALLDHNHDTIGSPLQVAEPNTDVSRIMFSPSGQFIAAATRHGIHLLNRDSSVRGNLSGAIGYVKEMAVTPGEDYLVAVGDEDFGDNSGDVIAEVWSLSASPDGAPILSTRPQIHSAAFAPDGQLMVTRNEDTTLRRWSLDGAQLGNSFGSSSNFSGNQWGRKLAIAAGGALIANARGFNPGVSDDQVDLYGAQGNLLTSLKAHKGEITAIAFSPNAKDLIAGWGDGSLGIFSIATGSFTALEHLHEDDISDVEYSRNGTRIVSGSRDGVVHLWTSDGKVIDKQFTGSGAIRDVELSPDGRYVAVVDFSKIYLWPTEAVAGNRTTEVAWGGATSAVFTDDGASLISISVDGSLGAWHVPSLELEGIATSGLRTPVRHIGRVGRSFWVLGNDNAISVVDSELRSQARIQFTDKGAIAYSTDGWYSGSESDRLAIFGGFAHVSEHLKAEQYSSARVVEAVTGTTPIKRRVLDSLKSAYARITLAYAAVPAVLQPLLWLAMAYVVVILIWVIRPSVFARFAMRGIDADEEKLLSTWKIIEVLSLVKWLGSRRRSVDAWLGANYQLLHEQCFSARPAVSRRSHYVELADSNAVIDALRVNRAVHWISGPGGCGKTTLAIHLASQLVERSGGNLLPIFIDTDWSGQLTEHVASLLTFDGHVPTASMVVSMMRRGRLLVVMDGLTERVRDDVVTQVFERSRDAQLMIVTSRDPAPNGERFLREVAVGPMPPERIAAFVAEYVDDAQTRELATDRISEFSRGEPISPLFALLALERLASHESLPRTYTGLVQAYVLALRSPEPDALSATEFLRASRIAAYCCVKEGFFPRQVPLEFMRGRIDAEAEKLKFASNDNEEVTSLAIIRQLVQCGLLTERIELAVSLVGFSDDPIAEYLAAMHVVALPDWEQIWEQVQEAPQSSFQRTLGSVRSTLSEEH